MDCAAVDVSSSVPGRKALGLERTSLPVAFLSCIMLNCLTSPPLSALGGAEPGDSGDKALAGSVRSRVSAHARLQHRAAWLGWLLVRCRWAKYPEGVEIHTPEGKPGQTESLTGTRGYPPAVALGQLQEQWSVGCAARYHTQVVLFQ